MPLFMGTRGDDILRWGESAQLVASLKDKLSQRWERLTLAEAASLVQRFQGALEEEIAFEAEAHREISGIFEQLERSAVSDLPHLLGRGKDEVARYFERRPSVLAHCEICNALHDRAAERVLALVVEATRGDGSDIPPAWALLVSGERGRGEQSFAGDNRYYLLFREDGGRVQRFAACAEALLQEAGFPAGGGLWHGELVRWRQHLVEGIGGAKLDEEFEAVADLGQILGDQVLGGEALGVAREVLRQVRGGELLFRLGRKAVSAPLAVGLFGRFRLAREGNHRGEIDLEGLGLHPLRDTVRILAYNRGIEATGTVERIKWLLERGELDVDLADRCLKAFQLLMQLKISHHPEEGNYLDPEGISEAQEHGFRGALETVHTLQKIAYQKLNTQG